MANDKREVEPAADLAPAKEPREQEPDEELPIPEEFLDSMPAEERNQFVQLISSITQFGGRFLTRYSAGLPLTTSPS